MFSLSFERPLALAALILIGACRAPHPQPAVPRVRGIETAVAHSGTVPEVYETTGTLRARTSSQLASKIVGNVTAVLAGEGDFVRRGQLLIQIDPRDGDAQLAKARAGTDEIEKAIDVAGAAESAARSNAELANATYRRFVVLRDRGSVSAHEFDEVEAQHKAADADLQRAIAARQQAIAARGEARANLTAAATFAGYDEIRSPIDGVVTAKFVDAGSQAAPGMPLLTVEDANASRIDAFVPDVIAASIRAGDRADVEGSDARVERVVPALDAATRTALVKLAFTAPTRLLPGRAVRIRLITGRRRALAVPDEAIVARGALRSVYVVEGGGIALMRLVTTGRSFGGTTEVLSGLDEGESFVRRVTPQFQDGVRIQ